MVSWLTDTTALSVVGGIVAAVTVGAVAATVVRRKLAKPPRKDYPRDTVILHQCARSPYAPSIVPFDIKLETFLRIAEVPYINEYNFQEPSSKGKWPWIEYNGKTVADSQFSIEFLKQERGLDLNTNLSSAERATARAFQTMLEVNTYWTWVLERWHFDKEKRIVSLVSIPKRYIYWVFPRLLLNQSYHQGMGRHTRDEILQILEGDLRAISDFLGQKKFLMGNRVSEVDCAVFGQLAQMKWHCPDSVRILVDQTFPNIGQYCDRMKELVWPDWDDCTTRGGTQEAKN